ncbi:MAG: TRAP transporter substrate-binding protein [Firmicutes bacterium]|jgi:tripartite ATP-independent transporter DctP family solute receptor|nr:TRAP transporter substrate-binding protein [Bacillota bacterium]MBQ1715623.1 TRAP transporter substrate-binding protein [Bacillota bacterium]MBQ2160809.1 TRAP transporter substrate-binding protein [Bacillota bacterium]MBQ2305382.1 TRAP transporter substrate-binding protein [Bacillota bacterium]
MKKFLVLLLAACMVFAFAACGGGSNEPAPADPEETFTLTIGTTVQDDSATGRALLEVFKPYIEEHSNGRIEVIVQNNSVLGSDREIYEALQLNTVQASQGPLSTLANFDPDFAVCDLPFLFTSKEEAYENLDGEFGDALAATLPQYGMRIIAYGENAFRNISNNQHPVKTAEDLKGLDIRVMESPVNIATYKAMGTNPTPMAFSELYGALQNGTVDGQDNGIVLTYTNKLYEVQPYYTFTHHLYAANAVVVSEEFWQSLPEDLQQVVTEASFEAMKFQRDLNTQLEDELVATMEAAGVTFDTLPDEEIAKLVEATKDVWDLVDVDENIMNMAKAIRDARG